MLKYGFFNSVNGDRRYDADDISNYFLKLISNGVFATPSNAMQVQAVSGMDIAVTPGWGFINSKWVSIGEAFPITLENADSTFPRKDRVVLALNYSSRNITLGVKKGTPAASPEAPALTRTEGVTWELSLAAITVGAGAASISQADITDERPDTELCGFVTGLIDQIDTTNLFAQFTAAFYNWFNELTESLVLDVFVGRYTVKYTTSAANERIIPINGAVYDKAKDSLAVYISGLRLLPDTDYSIAADSRSITLTKPISRAGTDILFDILKGAAEPPALPEYGPVTVGVTGTRISQAGIGAYVQEEVN